jgi:outer membrane protein assembly complex protein YaeT
MIVTERRKHRPIAGLAALALLLLTSASDAQSTDGPIVADVVTSGNRITPKAQIIGQLKTRPGLAFSESNAREDVQKLKESGAFADVRVRLQNTADHKVVVIFDLAELPSLIREITYNGAKHMKTADLESLTGLKRGVPLNPVANELACRAIEQKYKEDGRFYARVTLDEGGKIGDTRVVFNITEGPEVKVKKIEFVGHGSWVSSGRLRQQIVSSRTYLGIGGTFDPRKLEEDLSKLREYYRNMGYLDARIEPELIPSEDYSNVRIIFHIDEGVRYTVGHVEVQGNKQYEESQIRRMILLQDGKPFDNKVAQADIKAMQALYGYNGEKVQVHENIVQTSETGKVNVVYQISESEPVRIRNINIVGNEHTRENVVLRVLGLYEGQVLMWPEVQNAENRLAALGLFETSPEKGRPTITVVDTDDPRYKDVIVQVKETTTGSFMLGVGVNSDSGLTGNIVLNERNFDILRFPRSLDDLFSGNAFRGGGQEFRIEAMPGTQFQNYTATWREPALFDSRFGLAISDYYYERGFVEYAEERVGSRISVSRRLNRFWNFSETLRVEGIDIYATAAGSPPSIAGYAGWHDAYGFRTGLTRDSRDSYLRPTVGSILDMSFEQVTGSYAYPNINVDFSKFWTMYQRPDGSGKQVLSMRSDVQWTGDNTPVYDRIYGGGFHSLRGFEFRGIGPFVNGFNTGGDFAFLNTIEYQIPILANDKFYLVAFCDHGTVESKVNLNNYRVSAGFGFRVVTPLTGPVPLAFDFGFPIVKAPSDIKQIFAFYVGFGGGGP